MYVCMYVCVCVCVCVCFWQHFIIDTYLIEHNRHSLKHFLLIFLSYHIDFMIFGGNWLINLPELVFFPSTFCQITILEHQNNKQKLQILEALHIRNMRPKLNRLNFETSANVLKCL